MRVRQARPGRAWRVRRRRHRPTRHRAGDLHVDTEALPRRATGNLRAVTSYSTPASTYGASASASLRLKKPTWSPNGSNNAHALVSYGFSGCLSERSGMSGARRATTSWRPSTSRRRAWCETHRPPRCPRTRHERGSPRHGRRDRPPARRRATCGSRANPDVARQQLQPLPTLPGVDFNSYAMSTAAPCREPQRSRTPEHDAGLALRRRRTP